MPSSVCCVMIDLVCIVVQREVHQAAAREQDAESAAGGT